MDKKTALRIFLIAFLVIFGVLSVVAYALDYISETSTAHNDVSADSSLAGDDVAGIDGQTVYGESDVSSETPGDILPRDYAGSTHPYNTWNSPYSQGIDGYNYTDPQHYTNTDTP